MRWSRLVLTLALRSLIRPSVGLALARVGWRFRDRSWYRRFPFLPLPSRDYLRWRMHTAYGADDAIPPARDVIRYALWATKER